MKTLFDRALVYAVFLIIPAVLAPAAAQFAKQEVIAFESAVISSEDFLSGKKGQPVTLAGHLRVPKLNTKNPAVILMHGGTGLVGSSSPTHVWAQILNEAGIATFAVDSYAGRGVATLADTGPNSALARIVDAYRALALLAKHPLIDPDKIAIMGFSQGGMYTLYASMSRFQKMHGNANHQFAAFVSIYGNCGTTYHEDEILAARPVLLLHGMADDWVPIEPCHAYVARLVKAGMNTRLIAYPDAHHAFDAPGLREPVKLAQARSLRKCRLAEAEDGRIVNVDTKQAFTMADPCVEQGVTIHHNEAATKKAHADAVAFLKQAFGM